MEQKSFSWYKLDTAAQLFPAVSNPRNSSVFRLSVLLNEEVNKAQLEIAAKRALKDFPELDVKLRKGMFWRYLENASQPLLVEREAETPCQYMDDEQLNNRLLRVLYYQKRISIEVHHSLGDGLSLSLLLKQILIHYFKKGREPTENKYSVENAYKKYEQEVEMKKQIKIRKSCVHLKGTPYKGNKTIVYHGVLSVKELKTLSKKYETTITVVLLTLLIQAMLKQKEIRKKRGQINLAVPVNLRSFFPSVTVKNFFGVVTISIPVKIDNNFLTISKLIKEQLSEKLTKISLQEGLNANRKLEENPISKLTPLVIKEQLLKLGFLYLSESQKTITVSNLGRLDVSDDLASNIQHFEAIPYPTIKAPISCGIISSNESLTISFIKNIKEFSFIPDFFKLCGECGLEVSVYSNEQGK